MSHAGEPADFAGAGAVGGKSGARPGAGAGAGGDRVEPVTRLRRARQDEAAEVARDFAPPGINTGDQLLAGVTAFGETDRGLYEAGFGGSVRSSSSAP